MLISSTSLPCVLIFLRTNSYERLKFEKKNFKMIFGNIIVIATFAGLLIWIFQSSLPQVAVQVKVGEETKKVMLAYVLIRQLHGYSKLLLLADLSSPLAWLAIGITFRKHFFR